jgi:hypothetical protein
VLLSFPESYRNAHVFTNGLDRALLRAGRDDTLISFCVPVHVRDRRPEVGLAQTQPGRWQLRSGRSAPFDVPVVGSASSLSPGCEISGAGERLAPGLERRASARPLPRRRRVQYAYFDGERVVATMPAR